MTGEIYRKVLEVNRLRRELITMPQPGQDFSALVALERELAVWKAESAPDPKASVLNNRTQPVLLGAESTGLEAEVTLNMAQVPTSIAHLLDPDENPLVTISLAYVGPPADLTGQLIKRVRVTSFIEGYSATAVTTVELRRGGAAVSLHQLPTLFPDKLDSVSELTRATLNVAIEHLDSKELELQTTSNIWLLPRSTAVLEMKDPSTGKWKDLSRYLAAYVTPNAPEVMQVLSTAAKHLTVGSFAGYQPPPECVSTQVEALFNALKGAGLTYVNSVIAFGNQDNATMQRVRTPRESLKNATANCIDGAVLFASLLEAISLNPSIVIVPGHAFLGWESWPDGKWQYLETTMLGSGTYAEACKTGDRLAAQYGSLMNEIRMDEARAKYRISPMT